MTERGAVDGSMEDSLGLVPRPRRLVILEGAFSAGPAPLLVADGAFAPRLEAARGLLSAASGLAWGAALATPGAGTAALVARLEPGLAAEEYVLELRQGDASLAAATGAGFLNGIHTLRALFLLHGPNPPACRVEDGPRFGWRGFMLDCARNFFTVDFVERMIELASLHKLNRFHWHLSDDQAWRLDLAALPELAAKGSARVDARYHGANYVRGGAYSEDDVRRVVAFAADRGVEIVPELEFPGHATALLASHPELACEPREFLPEDRYGIFEDVLCLGNDQALAVAGRVLDEVARLFPAPWLHTGGDEVPSTRWRRCPRCRARADAAGVPVERLQGWFTREIARMVAERGKIPAFWDEALEAGAPAGSTVFAWRGAEAGREAAHRGLDAVMCPMTRACYLDHRHLDLPEEPGQHGTCTVADSYRFEPLEGLDADAAPRILGVQGNLWTELCYFGRQAEYQAFPRLSALAETAWTAAERKDFASFARRLGPWGALLDRLGVNRYRGPLE